MAERGILGLGRRAAGSLLPLLMAAAGSYGQQWTAPTAEELAMTSIAEVPGAPAVYLNRQQTTDDGLHMYSYYVRLKVLTDRARNTPTLSFPMSRESPGHRSMRLPVEPSIRMARSFHFPGSRMTS